MKLLRLAFAAVAVTLLAACASDVTGPSSDSVRYENTDGQGALGSGG